MIFKDYYKNIKIWNKIMDNIKYIYKYCLVIRNEKELLKR